MQNVTATNNTIGNCNWGLLINLGSNNDIENNTLFNNTQGLMFSNAMGNNILIIFPLQKALHNLFYIIIIL